MNIVLHMEIFLKENHLYVRCNALYHQHYSVEAAGCDVESQQQGNNIENSQGKKSNCKVFQPTIS